MGEAVSKFKVNAFTFEIETWLQLTLYILNILFSFISFVLEYFCFLYQLLTKILLYFVTLPDLPLNLSGKPRTIFKFSLILCRIIPRLGLTAATLCQVC